MFRKLTNDEKWILETIKTKESQKEIIEVIAPFYSHDLLEAILALEKEKFLTVKINEDNLNNQINFLSINQEEIKKFYTYEAQIEKEKQEKICKAN